MEELSSLPVQMLPLLLWMTVVMPELGTAAGHLELGTVARPHSELGTATGPRPELETAAEPHAELGTAAGPRPELGTAAGPCSLWFQMDSSSTEKCKCGSSLKGVVHCDEITQHISLLVCYRMTYSTHLNTTVVGHSLDTCKRRKFTDKSRYPINTNDSMMLNSLFCDPLNRTGQHCGLCKEQHATAVYSYQQHCIPCSTQQFKYNLFKYLAVAFLPQTVFYLLVITFKISATSGSMSAYVLTSQLLTAPSILKLLEANYFANRTYLKILASYLGIWNLDFFRSLYQPFCLHPEMNSLQVLALDYLVGVQPLLLILTTYLAITLHDRFTIIVKIWKPFHRVFSCIRREWNIRGSLIQSFATFLVLSYMKILHVSFDLLTPVHLMMPTSRSKSQYLYSNGEILLFGRTHLPYGILAISMLTVFNILPVLLLLLYPCQCFRECLKYCAIKMHVLQAFMDAFHGSYRHKPRDCRYFAALYLSVRFLQAAAFSYFRGQIFFAMTAFILILLTMAVLLVRPHTQDKYNSVDGFHFLVHAGIYLLAITKLYAAVYNPQLDGRLMNVPLTVLLLVPVIYSCTVLLRAVLPNTVLGKIHSKLAAKLFHNSNPPVLHDEYRPLLQAL